MVPMSILKKADCLTKSMNFVPTGTENSSGSFVAVRHMRMTVLQVYRVGQMQLLPALHLSRLLWLSPAIDHLITLFSPLRSLLFKLFSEAFNGRNNLTPKNTSTVLVPQEESCDNTKHLEMLRRDLEVALCSPNIAEIPQRQKNYTVRLHLIIPLWFPHSSSCVCKRCLPTKSAEDLMFTLGFILVFRVLNSKNVGRPHAHSETNLQLFDLKNDWAEVADPKTGAQEGQEPAPPSVATLLFGLTDAILCRHPSAKPPQNWRN